MGLFTGLFSGLTGGNYQNGGNYIVPPPPPSQQQLLAQLQAQSNQLHLQSQLAAQQMQRGLMGTHMSGNPEMYRIDQEVYKLTNYAEMCGDTVEMVDLLIGEETDDVKVAILKAADAGKYVKNVGIKIADNRFAVYREQGE